MRPASLTLLLVAFLVGTARAQDPAVTDSGKYKVVLENERVRVLEYHDLPGEKTTMHRHPDFVLYALGDFERQLTFGDGRQVRRSFKAGDVVWMEGQVHIGHNVGQTETKVLIVEFKEAAVSEDDAAGDNRDR